MRTGRELMNSRIYCCPLPNVSRCALRISRSVVMATGEWHNPSLAPFTIPRDGAFKPRHIANRSVRHGMTVPPSFPVIGVRAQLL